MSRRGFHEGRSARHRADYSRPLILVVLLVLCPPLVSQDAKPQKPRKALERAEVVDLLKGGVPPGRVEDLARQYGVSFALNAQTENELRVAGANDALLETLRQLAPKPAAPPVAPASPPSSAPPPAVLLIEATPGSAQVYVDDELMATTGPEGRLKLSQLSPGEHWVRLGLAGHRDYLQNIRLAAGQTVRITAKLEPAMPPAGSTPEPKRSLPDASTAPAGPATDPKRTVPATSTAPAPTPASTAPPAPAPASTTAPGPTPTGTTASVNPTVQSLPKRFRVVHYHGPSLRERTGLCVGLLTITDAAVHFRSERVSVRNRMFDAVHSYDFPRRSIKEARKGQIYIQGSPQAVEVFQIRQEKGPLLSFAAIDASNQRQPPDALLAAVTHFMGER